MKLSEKLTIARYGRKVRSIIKEHLISNPHNYYLDDDFTGCCGIASVWLKKVLRKQGIKSKLVVSKLGGTKWDGCHVYLIVGDYLVDITATQFNKKPIVIKPLKNAKEYFWDKPKEIKNPGKFFWGWGSQNPHNYKIHEENHLTSLLR